MTIEDGRPVQTREIQRLFSSRGLPRSLSRATFLALASFLVVAAVLFPAQQLEHRRAANLDARRNELSLQSSGLQPWDDTYTKVANTPYPINTVKLFPVLLLGDAALLVILAGILSKFGWKSVQVTRAGRWRFEHTDWLLVTVLTVIGATVRIVGSDRSLWIDEISTMAWHIRGPAIDTFLQALNSNNHLLNSLLSRAAVMLFGEHEWALRLPAIIFGTLSIPLLYFGVRRYSGQSRPASRPWRLQFPIITCSSRKMPVATAPCCLAAS